MSFSRGKRHQAREDAVQILYQMDLNADLSPQSAMQAFRDYFSEKPGEVDPFSQKLVVGVAENVAEIDKRIQNVSEHWKTFRMSAVDRNILRLGVFEICYCEDIPATVTINEMIELAKQFGAESSPAFVNGILDKIRVLYPSEKKVL